MNFWELFYVLVILLIPYPSPLLTQESYQPGDECDPETFEHGCKGFGPQCIGGIVVILGPGPVIINPVPGQKCPVIEPETAAPTEESVTASNPSSPEEVQYSIFTSDDD